MEHMGEDACYGEKGDGESTWERTCATEKRGTERAHWRGRVLWRIKGQNMAREIDDLKDPASRHTSLGERRRERNKMERAH